MQLFYGVGVHCRGGQNSLLCSQNERSAKSSVCFIHDPNKKILFHRSNLSQISNNKTTKHFRPTKPFFSPVNHLFPANRVTIHETPLCRLVPNFECGKIYQIDNLFAKKASRNKQVHLDKKDSRT